MSFVPERSNMFTVLKLLFVLAQNIITGRAEAGENEDAGRRRRGLDQRWIILFSETVWHESLALAQRHLSRITR